MLVTFLVNVLLKTRNTDLALIHTNGDLKRITLCIDYVADKSLT